MNIRLAAENDVENIKYLIDKNFDEIISKFHSPEIINKFKNYNSIQSLKDQLKWKKFYVVCDNEQIVATGAFANFGTEENPKYSVSNFYVLPSLHGRGIGCKLMLKLIDLAKENRAKIFHVPSTKNAIPFYTKQGFSVDNYQPDTKDEITWMSMQL